MTQAQLMAACGGKHIATGELGGAWHFGWNPSDDSTPRSAFIRDHDAGEDVPEIKGDNVYLWEFAKAANGGKNPPYNWQLTGSCVHGGAHNAVQIAMGIECVCLPQPEAFVMPCVLPAYGRSRQLLGQNSEGEGSTGETMAQALGEGNVTAEDSECPTPTILGPAFRYTKQEELRWSAYRNCPSGVKERVAKHKFQYIRIKSVDEAERELRRGRPLTVAGMWGGLMECEHKGEPRRLMNRRAGTWSHQQSIWAMERHPTLGRIFRWQNQWFMEKNGLAASVHGEMTIDGEPPGGYWTVENELEWQIRNGGEVYALYGFLGFTEKVLRWSRI